MAKKKNRYPHPDALLYPDHPRPFTRRDFVKAGLLTGPAMVTSGGILGLIARAKRVNADVAADLEELAVDAGCDISATAGNRVPFICIDLAGGANFAGSNVLVGKGGSLGQLDTIATAGQNKLGVPGDMVPGQTDPTPSGRATDNGDYTDSAFGLLFHSKSAMLQGMVDSAPTLVGSPNVNGVVVPARSANDTGNNPHNPLYGIAKAGMLDNTKLGEVAPLIGSRASDSGGNSMAPTTMIDPSLRPTKVDRPSDVVGLIDVGDLTSILAKQDLVATMEAATRIGQAKLGNVSTGLGADDAVVKNLVRCGYANAVDIADTFAGLEVNPAEDPQIVGASGIFSQGAFDGDANDGTFPNLNTGRAGREYRKTASVMKMVVEQHAGAGCITMGGYDYHTGDRSTGEERDYIAGRCIGAILDFARRFNSPVMVYVFSDGSVFSNGMIDDSVQGGGKGVWTGDNSQTAASFFLAYNPNSTNIIATPPSGLSAAQMQQVGYFNDNGDVVRSSSAVADSVLSLVDMVVLNYLAANGMADRFSEVVASSALSSNLDRYTVFNSLV